MSDMIFRRHGLSLRLHDDGGYGRPVMLQHGLTGDASQIREFLRPSAGIRRITLDCRGHGVSQAGDPADFSIGTFSDDVAAAIAALGVAPAVIGGVSMGAAIASRIAVRQPHLVSALILIRPAWVTEANPDNMQPNAEVGDLLARYLPQEARQRFAASLTATKLAAEAPDNLASLLTNFDRLPIEITSGLLTRISADGPGISVADLGAITVPTLVVGHQRDAIHPISHATALASAIPGARFIEITPKATDKALYLSDLASAVSTFLADHFEDTRP